MGPELTDEEIDASTCVVCSAKPCTLFTGDPWSWSAYCEEHSPDDQYDPQEDADA